LSFVFLVCHTLQLSKKKKRHKNEMNINIIQKKNKKTDNPMFNNLLPIHLNLVVRLTQEEERKEKKNSQTTPL